MIIMRIQHKRRMKQKTDYRKRLALLRSGKPRLIVRKSLENMRVHLAEFGRGGDRTVASAVSSELAALGWKSGNGNLPAAYLTGLLAGVRAKKAGLKEAVLDLGLQASTKGSRIYASLKGVIDAGMAVPHSKDILPTDERISGKHIQARAGIEKNFAETREKILKDGK